MARESILFYIILENGDKINDAINQEYISSTNETKSTIRTYIDNWYETTMTPYNSYLEDTI